MIYTAGIREKYGIGRILGKNTIPDECLESLVTDLASYEKRVTSLSEAYTELKRNYDALERAQQEAQKTLGTDRPLLDEIYNLVREREEYKRHLDEAAVRLKQFESRFNPDIFGYMEIKPHEAVQYFSDIHTGDKHHALQRYAETQKPEYVFELCSMLLDNNTLAASQLTGIVNATARRMVPTQVLPYLDFLNKVSPTMAYTKAAEIVLASVSSGDYAQADSVFAHYNDARQLTTVIEQARRKCVENGDATGFIKLTSHFTDRGLSGTDTAVTGSQAAPEMQYRIASNPQIDVSAETMQKIIYKAAENGPPQFALEMLEAHGTVFADDEREALIRQNAGRYVESAVGTPAKPGHAKPDDVEAFYAKYSGMLGEADVRNIAHFCGRQAAAPEIMQDLFSTEHRNTAMSMYMRGLSGGPAENHLAVIKAYSQKPEDAEPYLAALLEKYKGADGAAVVKACAREMPDVIIRESAQASRILAEAAAEAGNPEKPAYRAEQGIENYIKEYRSLVKGNEQVAGALIGSYLARLKDGVQVIAGRIEAVAADLEVDAKGCVLNAARTIYEREQATGRKQYAESDLAVFELMERFAHGSSAEYAAGMLASSKDRLELYEKMGERGIPVAPETADNILYESLAFTDINYHVRQRIDGMLKRHGRTMSDRTKARAAYYLMLQDPSNKEPVELLRSVNRDAAAGAIQTYLTDILYDEYEKVRYDLKSEGTEQSKALNAIAMAGEFIGVENYAEQLFTASSRKLDVYSNMRDRGIGIRAELVDGELSNEVNRVREAQKSGSLPASGIRGSVTRLVKEYATEMSAATEAKAAGCLIGAGALQDPQYKDETLRLLGSLDQGLLRSEIENMLGLPTGLLGQKEQ